MMILLIPFLIQINRYPKNVITIWARRDASFYLYLELEIEHGLGLAYGGKRYITVLVLNISKIELHCIPIIPTQIT